MEFLKDPSLVLFSLSFPQLWRSIDTLMGRGRAPINYFVSADDMYHLFDTKVLLLLAAACAHVC